MMPVLFDSGVVFTTTELQRLKRDIVALVNILNTLNLSPSIFNSSKYNTDVISIGNTLNIIKEPLEAATGSTITEVKELNEIQESLQTNLFIVYNYIKIIMDKIFDSILTEKAAPHMMSQPLHSYIDLNRWLVDTVKNMPLGGKSKALSRAEGQKQQLERTIKKANDKSAASRHHYFLLTQVSIDMTPEKLESEEELERIRTILEAKQPESLPRVSTIEEIMGDETPSSVPLNQNEPQVSSALERSNATEEELRYQLKVALKTFESRSIFSRNRNWGWNDRIKDCIGKQLEVLDDSRDDTKNQVEQVIITVLRTMCTFGALTSKFVVFCNDYFREEFYKPLSDANTALYDNKALARKQAEALPELEGQINALHEELKLVYQSSKNLEVVTWHYMSINKKIDELKHSQSSDSRAIIPWHLNSGIKEYRALTHVEIDEHEKKSGITNGQSLCVAPDWYSVNSRTGAPGPTLFRRAPSRNLNEVGTERRHSPA